MRYYLDCEFNGFGGALMSLALVADNLLTQFYAVMKTDARKLDPWVKANVWPHMKTVPPFVKTRNCETHAELAASLQAYLSGDEEPTIVTDWPDDVRYFCEAMITKPGEMISVPSRRSSNSPVIPIRFEIHRVDAYPTRVAEAVQHNAFWDAIALRQKLIDIAESEKRRVTT